MAKKILIFLLAIMLVACFVSCGEKDEVYTVTLRVEGAEDSIITVTNGVPSQELPESAEVPADIKDSHVFSHWYYINPQTGAEKKIGDSNALKSIKSDITLLPKYVEILEVSYVKDADGYYINNLGKKGVIEELVIPATYNGVKGVLPIVGVSKEAFKNETALVSITFQGEIKVVSNNAFDGCTALEKVIFEKKGIESLGKNIFRKVENVTEIRASAELVSQLAGTSKLTKVIITEGEVIGKSCFKDAVLLSSIDIAEGVTTIDDAAFMGCSKLSKIKIPSSVSYIGIDSFVGCVGLESIDVAKGNDHYTSGSRGNYIMHNKQLLFDEYGNPIFDDQGNQCFREHVVIAACRNTELDDDVEYIEEYAFNGISGLASLYIGANVIDIEENAFLGCSNIPSIKVSDINRYYTDGDKSNCLIKIDSNELILGGTGNIVIPDFVTTISNNAFTNCYDLESITIPASVTAILNGTFTNCKKLATVIIVPDSDGMILEDGAFEKTTIKNIELPTQYISYFVGIASSHLLSANINSGDNIGVSAFKNCNNLNTVTLNSDIVTINESAFEGCKSLALVVGGENIKTIGYSAFKGCSKFTKFGNDKSDVFHITENLIIDDSAFEGTGITKLKIDTRPTIGYRVFADCTKLSVLEIGEGIYIDYDAFAGCRNVTEAVIPADVILRTVRDSKNIKKLTITSGAIEAYAFKDCTKLTDLTIGKDVSDVQARAFEGCANLKNISVSDENAKYVIEGGCLVSDGVLVLGSCSADLTQLSDTTAKIAAYAFSGISVSEIEISENLLVESYAFYNCTGLTKITIKSLDVNNVAKYALDGCSNIKVADITTAFIGKFSWSALQTLTISSGNLIPVGAFKDCVTLKTVEILSNETDVGIGAFAGCVNLSTVSVNKTDDLKGFDCHNIRVLSILNINGVLEAGSLADFTELDKVLLNPGEYEVNGNPFSDDVVINTLIAPADVIEMAGASSLKAVKTLVLNSGKLDTEGLELPALTKLVIGGTDTEISAIAFTKAPILSTISIELDGGTHEYYSIYNSSLVRDTKLVLGVKSGAIHANIQEIGEYAFSGREIDAIVIPTGVEKIHSHAFANCALLNSCKVSKNIEIADKAFSFCTKLTSVELGEGVTIINGANPFEGCFAISQLSASAEVLNACAVSLDSVTTLTVTGGTWELLADAPLLVTLNINPGVVIVPGEYGLITGINSIKTINVDKSSNYTVVNGCILADSGKTLVLGTNDAIIPDGVTKIAAYAFKGCTDFVSVTIPASVSEIEANAFYGCAALEEITVDSSNPNFTSMDNAVLSKDGTVLYIGCKNTKISNIVTTIAPYAFAGTGIESVVIPSSVTVIGEGAFNSCESLTKVVFAPGSQVTRFEASVFARCVRLAKVVVPAGVEFIHASAFYNCENVSVYYCGNTVEEWKTLRNFVDDSEITNVLILDDKWYYYVGSDGIDIRDI